MYPCKEAMKAIWRVLIIFLALVIVTITIAPIRYRARAPDGDVANGDRCDLEDVVLVLHRSRSCWGKGTPTSDDGDLAGVVEEELVKDVDSSSDDEDKELQKKKEDYKNYSHNICESVVAEAINFSNEYRKLLSISINLSRIHVGLHFTRKMISNLTINLENGGTKYAN